MTDSGTMRFGWLGLGLAVAGMLLGSPGAALAASLPDLEATALTNPPPHRPGRGEQGSERPPVRVRPRHDQVHPVKGSVKVFRDTKGERLHATGLRRLRGGRRDQ